MSSLGTVQLRECLLTALDRLLHPGAPPPHPGHPGHGLEEPRPGHQYATRHAEIRPGLYPQLQGCLLQ